jgi:hypothetical protein
MVMITFVKAAAFLAAVAPLDAFMPSSTFGVKVRIPNCIFSTVVQQLRQFPT